MLPTKIVVIGAGSASFGLNTVAALLGSARLRGSQLLLVDRNPETLGLMHALAIRLNREWAAEMSLGACTQVADALPGAHFVVSAIEVPPRERLWRQDYEIPLRHGVRQPYSENGGPGGFAHAARTIGPVLEIVQAMEAACPDAWFINYSNPMVRICDAIHRYSKIRAVGLCHQIYAGYGLVGYLLSDRLGFDLEAFLAQEESTGAAKLPLGKIGRAVAPLIDIKAAGLNHFTWMLDVRDRRTGEDLYPLVAERWAQAPASFQPLTWRVYRAFGLMPIPADGHLCEYLPWLTNPATRPWEKYDIHLYDWDEAERRRDRGLADIALMGKGEQAIDRLRSADSEGALEMIESIAGAGNHYHLALNLPNRGYITNLPPEGIVEVPGVVSGAGPQDLAVGSLPEPVAELLRREMAVGRLAVDAAVSGDRQAALQCLLLDPVIGDLDLAQEILDDYLETYRQYLPAFWH